MEEIIETEKIEEVGEFIYFDENKQAYAQKIDNYLCKISPDLWAEFCTLTISKEYDIIDGELVDLRQSAEYIADKFEKAKNEKFAENIQKAKQAIENGFVIFKNAEFETNAQTVGDLTATMLLMQASEMETYTWLSKDDKEVELTIEDFGTLGGLIAQFKGDIWQNKYVGFKAAIEQAETIEKLDEIIINYEVI